MNNIVKGLILSSEKVTYNFKDGRVLERNIVVFAFEDFQQTEVHTGLSIAECSISGESFDITKKLKPNEFVNLRLGRKSDRDNPKLFSFVIESINNVEV